MVISYALLYFPGGSFQVKNLREMQRAVFYPWVGKIHWRREWLYIPVLLPGKFHGQRSLVGYIGGKELDMTEKLTFPLSW